MNPSAHEASAREAPRASPLFGMYSTSNSRIVPAGIAAKVPVGPVVCISNTWSVLPLIIHQSAKLPFGGRVLTYKGVAGELEEANTWESDAPANWLPTVGPQLKLRLETWATVPAAVVFVGGVIHTWARRMRTAVYIDLAVVFTTVHITPPAKSKAVPLMVTVEAAVHSYRIVRRIALTGLYILDIAFMSAEYVPVLALDLLDRELRLVDKIGRAHV